MGSDLGSGSDLDQKFLDPTGLESKTLVQLIFFYFSGMYAWTTIPFTISPSYTISTSSKTVIMPPETVPAPDPAYWYCSFYRKLFYCTIFYLSFLFLWCVFFCSFLQGALIFSLLETREFFRGGLSVLAVKPRRSRKRGLVIISKAQKINAPWC